MQPAPRPLPDDPQELKHLLLLERTRTAEQEALIDQLKQRFHAMLEQFRLAQKRRFGSSSESADQLGLFNETEAIVEAEASAVVEQPALTHLAINLSANRFPATCRARPSFTISRRNSATAAVMNCTGWARNEASSWNSSRRRSR